MAAEWAGFETVAQCEIDDYASKVLAKNFKGVPNLHDIRTVTNERLGEYGINSAEITVISAGFPCQPYSLAGKGRGDSDERDLWGEVARVLGEIKPRWFVGENTPGLFARQNQRYFRRVLNDLTALGYNVGWGIWGACDVGANHKRERVFLCAFNSHSNRRSSFKLQSREPCKTLDKTSERQPCRADRIYDNISNPSGERKTERRNCKLQEIAGTEMDGTNIRSRAKKYVGWQWWQTEPDVGRVANGVSARVDRLKCLGNAVVPQQAYPIFEAIAKLEKEQRL